MDILLDSGAFSAWNLGERIDLDDYIGFVKANKGLIYRCINLDKIPGDFGIREWRPDGDRGGGGGVLREPAKDEREPGSTRSRFSTRMKTSAGWRNISTDGEDYICLSASQRSRRSEKLTWLRECSKLLCSQGRPLVRTHGLGETSTLICHQFPFTTVDSRRWFIAAAYGQIPIPIYCGGKPDYTLDPQIVFVTERTRGRPNHIDMRDDRERIDRFLDRGRSGCGAMPRWARWDGASVQGLAEIFGRG